MLQERETLEKKQRTLEMLFLLRVPVLCRSMLGLFCELVPARGTSSLERDRRAFAADDLITGRRAQIHGRAATLASQSLPLVAHFYFMYFCFQTR